MTQATRAPFNVVAAVMARAFPTLAAEKRSPFERRDERTQAFFDGVDQRQGPRRFDEVDAARITDHVECL